jgi:hypothetical protein
VATLTVGIPPQITVSPTNRLATAGTLVLFNSSATGTGPLTFQWLFNQTNLSDGGRISGSLSPTLTISNTVLADTGSYMVLVTNAFGSAMSAVATLTVGLAPQITTQPTNRLALLGSGATFVATASGSVPLAYQWQFNGTNLTDGPRIAGSGTNTLSLTNLSFADAGAYQLFVSNSFGAITSLVAALSVAGPPVIKSAGLTQNGFTVTWAAVPGFTYQAQYTTNLAPACWLNLGAPVTATNSTAVISDSLTTDPSRFYRVALPGP